MGRDEAAKICFGVVAESSFSEVRNLFFRFNLPDMIGLKQEKGFLLGLFSIEKLHT